MQYYQSLIFIGDNSQLEKFISNEFSFKPVSSPDLLVVTRKSNKKSLGIAELNIIKEFALLKSYTSNEKVIRIEDGETLTIEAQNSLLKILEEPPQKTLIVIRCNKFPNFLNTIFSRCKIVDKTLSSEFEINNDNGDFLELPLLERFELINKITSLKPEDKQKAVEELIINITANLVSKLEENIENRDKILELEQKLTKVKDIRQKIRQNVNIKLSLDNLALVGNN